jgi:hypothetical protein
MVTVYNDGATHTITSGTYAGILVDVDGSGTPTTLVLSGSTVTGPNAHESYPPSAFTDVEGGVHGIVVMPTCFFTDSGGNNVTGGDGLAGITTESFDGSSGLDLPTYTPGDGIYAVGATTSFSTLSTYTGGNYAAGATGSAAYLGGVGARIIDPVSVSIGNVNFQGGSSESTLPGASGLHLALNTTGSVSLGVNPTNPTAAGGSGASTGAGITVSNAQAGLVALVNGHWGSLINAQFVAGGTLRFVWAFGSPGTLTTSSVSGNLFGGDAISATITGAGGATVFNSGSTYSELQF